MKNLCLILFFVGTLVGCTKSSVKPKNPTYIYPSPTETGTNEVAWKVDSVAFFEKVHADNVCVLQVDTVNKSCSLTIETPFVTEEGKQFGLDLVNDRSPLTYPIADGTIVNIPFGSLTSLMQNIALSTNGFNVIFLGSTAGRIVITHFDAEKHIISGTFDFATLASTSYPTHAITDGWFDFVYLVYYY